MIFKNFEKRIKKLRWYDISFIKLTVATVTLALVSGWQFFQNWVIGIDWYWFIGVAIIFGILPIKHFWFD
jgi:hypothetical protein